jgi:1-acylglycerol-3-phosphate O-acyltransferase
MGNHSELFPQPGSIIAASLTSPLDALYLAVIFDPIFTASYPSTRLVQPISLLTAIVRAFAYPEESPSDNSQLVDIPTLISRNPGRYIVVFPECTTTNGRGILKFSPSLLGASPKTKIYPTSLRYTPADVTTPVPGSYLRFLWNLLSKPTHSLRVRIAQNTSTHPSSEKSYIASSLESLHEDTASGSDSILSDDDKTMTAEERRLLDKIGETLARLGRNKRVGLGVKEKQGFIQAWKKHKKA